MFQAGQTFQQFLDDYYSVGLGGYLYYVGEKHGESMRDDVRKILTATETNWYEAAYSKGVQLMFPQNTEIYKLLDKRPITSVGDSFKYTSAHGLTKTALGPLGATAMFGTPTEPTVASISNITSGVENVILARDLHSMVKERAPGADIAGSNWAWLTGDLAPKALWTEMDKWLGGRDTAANVDGVDTPALKNIECIDRMISNGTESGAANYVSLATDGDIIWDGIGTGTHKVEREAGADAWSNAQVKLATTPGADGADAFEIVKELEALMVEAKRYSPNKRYIGLTTGSTMNKIQNELGTKQRYVLDKEVDVRVGINGVETRPGAQGGFPVGALVLAGVTVPFFTSESLPHENTVFTTDTSGHCYLIDLDSLFIRVDIPVTYLESGFGPEMLSINLLASRGFLFTLSQLVCNNFQAQAALKWIRA